MALVTASIYSGDLSDDGEVVAFWTRATGIAPGDVNSIADVWEFTASTGVHRLISRARDGQPANGDSMHRRAGPLYLTR